MLSIAKVPLSLWGEAIATACFTQNRSLVIPRHEKTPYHIINDRKPSVKFFYIFGSYPKDTSFELTAFLDSDHAGCLDSRNSTSSGIQFLDGDKLVSWSSKKQDCTLMSSAEAEYVSLSACCALAISCNPVQHSRTKHIDVRYHFIKEKHSRTKHIDVRYHFIKEKVEKGIVELFFVGTEYQLADLFIKALPVERFQYLVRRLGMRCLTPAELEALANESA
nr:retrovirus-related Pol polyprotein from transposon TNT 1-94 [Tanacetum cinerariifolium]